MRIAIVADINPQIKWTPHTINNAGLGSMYTSTWGLARTLALKHEVVLLGYINRPDFYEGVAFTSIQRPPKDQVFDLIICVDCMNKLPITAKKTVLWFHHAKPNEAIKGKYDVLVLNNKKQEVELASQMQLTISRFVIPNGVNKEFLNEPMTDKKMDVVFSGHPVQGMSALKPIYESLRDYKRATSIHVYGNAELWGWDNDQFNDMYSSLVKGGIFYHGKYGMLHISQRLAESKVFVYPCDLVTHTELAALEAMAVGCVPVTTDSGNLNKIIENGKNGFIIEGSTADVGWYSQAANKINQLLCNPELLNSMSVQARKKIKYEYSWDKIVAQWDIKIL